MRARDRRSDGLFLLQVTERTLVKPPDWDDFPGMQRQNVRLVALDLAEAQFVSSLFWEGCVSLKRKLAADGRELALLNLSDQQKQVLEMVEGATQLSVLDSERQLESKLEQLCGGGGPDRGVTGTEKRMLWL